jgi:uncharacterized membrane protein HdeD (DUF308 family)
MAMFLASIAFLLEVFLIAAGLVLISLSKEHRGLFSGAGWLLIIVGILGAICTFYYSMHYYNLGDFAHAYPQMMMPEKT